MYTHVEKCTHVHRLPSPLVDCIRLAEVEGQQEFNSLIACGMKLLQDLGPHVQRLAWIFYWNMAYAQTQSNVQKHLDVWICAHAWIQAHFLCTFQSTWNWAHMSEYPTPSCPRPYLHMQIIFKWRVPDSIPIWGLSVWSLHVLPMYAWVLSRYSGFLPPSKNMHGRLTGDSKLSLGVSVSVCGRLSLCGPVMDWRPVQDVPCPFAQWPLDRLQPPHDPTDGLSGYRKWMDI